jgi:uncharacterized protein YndB with AHSA1/START domain
MNAPRIITNSININATPEKVWQALTAPSETKKYMFGCEALSDWKVGSPLLWEGEWEGKKMVFVKGHIANIRPNEHLSYTVFDPNNQAMEDIPENYLTVTYDLQETADGTQLTVTQGDYNKVADGERRYQESYNNGEGWNPILVKIKEQVEAAG